MKGGVARFPLVLLCLFALGAITLTACSANHKVRGTVVQRGGGSTLYVRTAPESEKKIKVTRTAYRKCGVGEQYPACKRGR